MRRRLLSSILASLALAAVAAAQSEFPNEILSRVVPVVSSTPGNLGSYFRTGLQLRNAGGSPLNGRFVYHPANAPASVGDPSVSFNLPSGATKSYDDIVATLGLTGLGSLDLMLPPASASPVIVTRVFNDAGAAGSSGFTEEAVDPNDSGVGSAVLTFHTTGVLVAPADLTAFRFNIGLRTLSSGAEITIRVRNAAGASTQLLQKSYSPNYFQQSTADALLLSPLSPDDSIEIFVGRGSLVIYGATIDNTTQDPSIQYARVVASTP